MRKAFWTISLYAFWIFGVRLLTLSLITYFTASPTSHLQDIHESFISNEVTLIGSTAFLFIAFLSSFRPMTSTRLEDIFSRKRIEREFFPGFLQGTLLGGALILIYILTGTMRSLGSQIQLGEAPLRIATILFRMTVLCVFAYAESWIFFHQIPKQVKRRLPELVLANGLAVLYCGIKVLQFDLDGMQVVTLYLVAILLFYRMRQEDSFARGAGYWAGLLVLFSPLLSLPLFGNEFQGILWLKVQIPILENKYTHVLTGGVGGPISSFALQLLLIMTLSRSMLKNGDTRTIA